MYLMTENNINMPDLFFFELCKENFGINRGVFNTIDSMFYDKGFMNIHHRRKEILNFLEYSFGEPKVAKCPRNKFGHGGLSLKLNEYCLISQVPLWSTLQSIQLLKKTFYVIIDIGDNCVNISIERVQFDFEEVVKQYEPWNYPN